MNRVNDLYVGEVGRLILYIAAVGTYKTRSVKLTITGVYISFRVYALSVF